MPEQEPPLVPRLSKSKYLSGLQCHKRLFLEIRSPELATEMDEAAQARMDMGTEVGELARKRFPGGVHVEHDHLHRKEALQQTAELLNDPSVPAIFEGAFEFEDALVRVDILERVGKSQWRLIEVKATGSVKDVHLDDLAILAYVIKGAGVDLAGSYLMHLDTQYVYQGGELDIEQLFALEDLSAEVNEPVLHVPNRVAEMKAMLKNSTPPTIEPDHHCFDPYECPFWKHCTQAKPERWIFHLPGRGRAELFQQLVQQGIESIDDIPAGVKLNAIQQRVKENVEWVHAGLKAALKTVHYPVHHLDFETFNPAIPKFPQTRPYQVLPFQWSNHVETEDGRVTHDEYLCTTRDDSREELALKMLASLGKEGSICVYSSYEKTRIKELAEAFPKLKRELERVTSRLWDLYRVIPSHYYHPQFNGSYSLKKVLPAVIPSLNYHDLEIQDGDQASEQYYRMIFEEIDATEKERIRQALLKYCQRDTLAMVELRRVLLAKAVAAAS
jgi:predicted RecB family nuclease